MVQAFGSTGTGRNSVAFDPTAESQNSAQGRILVPRRRFTQATEPSHLGRPLLAFEPTKNAFRPTLDAFGPTPRRLR